MTPCRRLNEAEGRPCGVGSFLVRGGGVCDDAGRLVLPLDQPESQSDPQGREPCER